LAKNLFCAKLICKGFLLKEKMNDSRCPKISWKIAKEQDWAFADGTAARIELEVMKGMCGI
jgi:hypothetical protein